jgi:hypothetical protein
VRYEAGQILREPGNPAASVRASKMADCFAHTENWDMVLRYGTDDTGATLPPNSMLPRETW